MLKTVQLHYLHLMTKWKMFQLITHSVKYALQSSCAVELRTTKGINTHVLDEYKIQIGVKRFI